MHGDHVWERETWNSMPCPNMFVSKQNGAFLHVNKNPKTSLMCLLLWMQALFQQPTNEHLNYPLPAFKECGMGRSPVKVHTSVFYHFNGGVCSCLTSKVIIIFTAQMSGQKNTTQLQTLFMLPACQLHCNSLRPDGWCCLRKWVQLGIAT